MFETNKLQNILYNILIYILLYNLYDKTKIIILKTYYNSIFEFGKFYLWLKPIIRRFQRVKAQM